MGPTSIWLVIKVLQNERLNELEWATQGGRGFFVGEIYLSALVFYRDGVLGFSRLSHYLTGYYSESQELIGLLRDIFFWGGVFWSVCVVGHLGRWVGQITRVWLGKRG